MTVAEKMKTMLDESKTKSEGILQAAADAIITFDSKTMKIDVFNTSAEKMFGYNMKNDVYLQKDHFNNHLLT